MQSLSIKSPEYYLKFGSSVSVNGTIDTDHIRHIGEQILDLDAPTVFGFSGDVAAGKRLVGPECAQTMSRPRLAKLGGAYLDSVLGEVMGDRFVSYPLTDRQIEDPLERQRVALDIGYLLGRGKAVKFNQRYDQPAYGSSGENDRNTAWMAETFGSGRLLAIFSAEIAGIQRDPNDMATALPRIDSTNIDYARSLIIRDFKSEDGTGGGETKLEAVWSSVVDENVHAGLIGNGRRENAVLAAVNGESGVGTRLEL